VTEQQLIEIFTEVGPVVQFRLVFDKDTGKAKGFGFCTFQDSEIAASAVRNLNNFDIGGRQLRIDFAESDTKDEPPSRYDDQSAPAQSSTYAPQPVISTGSSTDAITKALETIPSHQLLDAMAQLKLMAVNAPDQVHSLLSANPQLTYAIFQAMIAMNVIDASILQKMGQSPAGQPVVPTPMPPVVQNTGVMGVGFPQIVPAAAAAPMQAVAAAGLVDAEQQQLLMQVLSMTPEQIQALPLDQRAGVIQLVRIPQKKI
ncbi:hinge domain of cleavage stimulation factor subunit 2-domain-containing protein, partial [Obelidium mucronatum]